MKATIEVHEFDPKAEKDFHSHDYFEITYIKSGFLHHELEDGEAITFHAGNLCVICPGEKHRATIEDEAELHVIHVSQAFLQTSFSRFMVSGTLLGNYFLNHALHFPNKRQSLALLSPFSATTENLIQYMKREQEKSDHFSLQNMEILLILLFNECQRLAASSSLDFGGRTLSAKAQAVVGYLSHHVEEATLESTATYFGMHPNSFSAFFHRETGESFSHVLKRLRINTAKELLLTTNLTVEKIALMTGYNDPNSFIAFFRRNVGTTPANFRHTVAVSPA